MARAAAERGVRLMALTDHNSARNAPAFAAACARVGITPLFGTETTSREEVHILSIFADIEEALDWGRWIYPRLPDFKHDPEKFWDQVVVDVDENVIDFEERYLIPAIDASIEEITAETLDRGGLIIPAHIDRSANSLISQLGFLPDGDFSAIEVTKLPPIVDPGGLCLICDSDAHFIDDVAQRSFVFELERGTSGGSGAAGGSWEPPTALSSRAAFDALTAALKHRAVRLSLDGGKPETGGGGGG
jgi:hypothetical protein